MVHKTFVFGVLLVAAGLAGCAGNNPFGGPYKSADPQGSGPAMAASSSTDDMAVQSDSGMAAQPVAPAQRQVLEAGIIKAFPDIPIPSTHKIDLERSVIFTSPTQTVGKVALAGNGDVDALYRFFEEQMAANGWSLVNAFQSATSSLYFAKPGRFVAVIIEAGAGGGSRVYINVGPE